MERTHVELPPHVRPPFEIFVNGVQQAEGADYELIGSTLVFEREFKQEGKLGWWRWALLFLGIAGTYRQHDSIDVVYTVNGRRAVSSLRPVRPLTLSSE